MWVMSEGIKKFIGEWANPQGIVVVIGFIIWLVQLNFGFLSHSKQIAILQENAKLTESINTKQNEQILLTAQILKDAVVKLEKLDDRFSNHASLPAHPIAEEKLNRLEREFETLQKK